MSRELDFELLDGGRKLPIVEHFYSVQGEGFHTGKAAYFIRVGGCDVGCRWCDAKESWNPKIYPPIDVAEIVEKVRNCAAHSIVITGGEPLTYPLDCITKQLHNEGVEIFLETSGTQSFSGNFDWICLSPKRQKPPLSEICEKASELKVIIESKDDFLWAEECSLRVSQKCLLYLQPEWSKMREVMGDIVEYVKSNPRWNISLQSHKFMKIP